MDEKQFEELNKKLEELNERIDELDAKFTKAHNDKNNTIRKLRPLVYLNTILLIVVLVLVILPLIS